MTTGDGAHVPLVRDTAGNSHYIGPSGSLAFFAQVRRLVSSRHPPGKESIHPSSNFAGDDTAEALEAERQEAPEPEPEENSDQRDGPSPASVASRSSRDFSAPTHPDMDQCLKQLPSHETIDARIQFYFGNCHGDFPLFHRATFEEEYETYIVQARTTSTRKYHTPHFLHSSLKETGSVRPDWGWLACLHMILAFGTNGGNDDSVRQSSLSITRSLLPQLVSSCSESNVRALLLLSLFLHNNSERNAAWIMVGAATRISLALGLHRSDVDLSFRPFEREMRKRIFCTLYCFEQFLSSSLGRPSGINDFDVDIRPPREGLLDGGSGGVTESSQKLHAILGMARKTSLGPRAKSEQEVNPSLSEIFQLLEAWKGRVPDHLDLPTIFSVSGVTIPIPGLHKQDNPAAFDELKESLSHQTPQQLRALILLHIQYNYIGLLVSRPALLRHISSNNTSTESPSEHLTSIASLSESCIFHGCQLALLIVLMDAFDLLNGTFSLDVFYGYSAAMVLTLRLLRVPSKATISPSEQFLDPGEAQLHITLRHLIRLVQNSVARICKSGTMRRLARVMNKFAEFACNVTNDYIHRENDRPEVQQTISQREGHHADADCGGFPNNILATPNSSTNSSVNQRLTEHQTVASNNSNPGLPFHSRFEELQPPTYLYQHGIYQRNTVFPQPGLAQTGYLNLSTPSTSPPMLTSQHGVHDPSVTNQDVWSDCFTSALQNGDLLDWAELENFLSSQNFA